MPNKKRQGVGLPFFIVLHGTFILFPGQVVG
jgi:hypothetical protein